MLSKDFLLLILISFVFAFPMAYWVMNKWLQSFAYRISVGWQVFLIAGFCAFGVALLTIGYRAIKAANANPVNSLKSD